MTPANFTSQWMDHYLMAASVINRWMHMGDFVIPIERPTPTTLLEVLQNITDRVYDPSKHFRRGSYPEIQPHTEPPAITKDINYPVIGLNAVTMRSRRVSVSTGGILFEDPYWAFLAAWASGGRHDQQFCLPRAKSVDDLWKNVRVAQTAINHSVYQPSNFFEAIDKFASATPRFELLTISPEQLVAIRQRGMQALNVSVPPKFYEMFTP